MNHIKIFTALLGGLFVIMCASQVSASPYGQLDSFNMGFSYSINDQLIYPDANFNDTVHWQNVNISISSNGKLDSMIQLVEVNKTIVDGWLNSLQFHVNLTMPNSYQQMYTPSTVHRGNAANTSNYLFAAYYFPNLLLNQSGNYTVQSVLDIFTWPFPSPIVRLAELSDNYTLGINNYHFVPPPPGPSVPVTMMPLVGTIFMVAAVGVIPAGAFMLKRGAKAFPIVIGGLVVGILFFFVGLALMGA